MKHTLPARIKESLPLRYYESEEGGDWRVRGVNGLPLGEFASEEEAAYYCQAVNCHSEMVEALVYVIKEYQKPYGPDRDLPAAIRTAKQVVDKASGLGYMFEPDVENQNPATLAAAEGKAVKGE